MKFLWLGALLCTALFMMLHFQRAFAAERPRVVVLATGGTIAGCASSAAETAVYRAGVLGVDALLSAVPELRDHAEITGEQLCNIDSKDMTDEIWLRLACRVNAILAADEADGVVITHGTDTMEETAYFLTLTLKSEKPVVLTGAMLPATATGADGPRNLLDAVRVAACPASAGKGVLVVMNGEIHAARDVTKAHTQKIDAFISPTVGRLGVLDADGPVFSGAPLRCHTVRSEFDAGPLPRVDILYGHESDDGALVEAAVRAGAQGIVYAGMGNGSIPAGAEKALAEAAAGGIVVVRSSRTGNGAGVPSAPSNAEAGV
ncbi:MAG: asparaginase, partial [Oscillospiraceae bacterium]|nr:asparaginase [Oscillospiraceae bacterium]